MTYARAAFPAGIAIVVMLFGCSNSPESLPEGRQGQSLLRPDGITRAFVWVPTLSGGFGATMSQPYQVWIENKQFDSKALVVEGYKANGFRLVWLNTQTLEVCYADARIYKFLNGVDFATEKSPEMVSVEIVLRRVQNLHSC